MQGVGRCTLSQSTRTPADPDQEPGQIHRLNMGGMRVRIPRSRPGPGRSKYTARPPHMLTRDRNGHTLQRSQPINIGCINPPAQVYYHETHFCSRRIRNRVPGTGSTRCWLYRYTGRHDGQPGSNGKWWSRRTHRKLLRIYQLPRGRSSVRPESPPGLYCDVYPGGQVPAVCILRQFRRRVQVGYDTAV